jgi:hypothetical protein
MLSSPPLELYRRLLHWPLSTLSFMRMIIVRRFLEAALRRSLKPPRTSLSDKDVAALMTAHAVTAVTAVIAATILTGVTLDATTVATIAGMIARLATDEEEGVHLLEEDVAVDVAGVARRPGST